MDTQASLKLSVLATWLLVATLENFAAASGPPSPCTSPLRAMSLPCLPRPLRCLLELYVLVSKPFEQGSQRLLGVNPGLVEYAVFGCCLHYLLFGCLPHLRLQVGVRLAEQPSLAIVNVGLVVVQFALQYFWRGQPD